MDKATLTLGDNQRVDLSQTVIVLTSNLGAIEITELMGGGIGFVRQPPTTEIDNKVERTAVEAAKRKFSPEFMNRIDKLVVFHSLRSEHLNAILEIELEAVQQRILNNRDNQFLIRVTSPAREYLLREGTDLKYGARHLKRAIERHVVCPIANLLTTKQLRQSDILTIDWNDAEQRLVFMKGEETAMLVMPEQTDVQIQAAQTKSGRTIEFPVVRARGASSWKD